ncbi:MAG: 50S ribosomal protein L17 [Vampirovibrio sp.]|jgi:large subunit ribosomal protein L17|nr:50S ribosomal protein L17 [Vampirovibrio sp.]
MRHRNKLKKLSRPADQRKALLRALTTQLFLHGEIMTTLTRAKALIPEASKVVTWAKRGDLHAVRLASKKLYRVHTGETFPSRNGKPLQETVLRKVFKEIGPRYEAREGGYVRVVKAPNRRGDNAPMAIVQLV